jgi:hypothetical protein
MPPSRALPHPSDVSAYCREWPVLLECASPRSDVRKLSELIQTADWPRLLCLAEEHGVVGHLAAASRKLDSALIPPEIEKALADQQRAQVLSSLRMTAELFRVLECFASVGIEALVVKGPVLAVEAYGDPAMRRYGDLDLLVRGRDIRRATEVMIASGYDAKVPLTAIDAGKIPGQYLFYKADTKLLVELHNDRTLRYFPRRLPLEKFFARQIRVPLDAHEAPALSVEDELVLISIHGAKHFWERLIWIADVAALVTRQAGIDWQRVAATAKEVGARHMLLTGLGLAADLLKARLPETLQEEVDADAVAAHLAHQISNWLPAAGYAPPGLLERARFRMRIGGGLLSGAAYLIRLSFSPTEEDWEDGLRENRHPILDALRRPFRLAQKHGRANRS